MHVRPFPQHCKTSVMNSPKPKPLKSSRYTVIRNSAKCGEKLNYKEEIP